MWSQLYSENFNITWHKIRCELDCNVHELCIVKTISFLSGPIAE
jgi:hypothetical protein